MMGLIRKKFNIFHKVQIMYDILDKQNHLLLLIFLFFGLVGQVVVTRVTSNP